MAPSTIPGRVLFTDNLNIKPNSKDKEHICLSNFYICPINIDDRSYHHAEGFYQSSKYAKCDEKAAEHIRNVYLPQLCKRAVDKYKMNSDALKRWEAGERCIVMKRVLISKFIDNTDLAKYLVSTRNSELVYNVLDEFWGIGEHGKGKNILGKMLMEVRDIISSLTNNYNDNNESSSDSTSDDEEDDNENIKKE